MYSVLVILAVVVAVLLTFVVLIQESKGGGLASSFASSNQIMGVRKTTDVVEKATWTLAGLLVVISIATNYVSPQEKDSATIVTTMSTTPVSLPGQTQNAAPASAPSAPAQK